MDDVTIGFVGTGVLIVLVLAGVRVVYATATVGLLGVVAMIGWDAGATNIGMIPHAKGSVYALSVIPMFILIGFLAFHAGMTQALFDAARKWLGWVPGGLAVATVMATAGFAAVSGASTATAAVFSRVAIPEMLRYGYDQRLAAGIGNVYKNEVLWACEVSPFRPLADVDEAMRRRLYETGAAQLQANLGRWKRQTHPKGLAVYDRAGQGCYRCLGRIRTVEHGDIGRRTWWCANCQT